MPGSRDLWLDYLVGGSGRGLGGSWDGGGGLGDGQEVVLVLVLDVPGVVGAASELVETGGLLGLHMVQLGLGLFGVPEQETRPLAESQLRVRILLSVHLKGGDTLCEGLSQFTRSPRTLRMRTLNAHCSCALKHPRMLCILQLMPFLKDRTLLTTHHHLLALRHLNVGIYISGHINIFS